MSATQSKIETSKGSNDRLFKETTNFQMVVDLVRQFPNNAELGAKVRQLVRNYNKPNKEKVILTRN